MPGTTFTLAGQQRLSKAAEDPKAQKVISSNIPCCRSNQSLAKLFCLIHPFRDSPTALHFPVAYETRPESSCKQHSSRNHCHHCLVEGRPRASECWNTNYEQKKRTTKCHRRKSAKQLGSGQT